jgi:pimeloyl-ACP methyl ester carboxylesterase
MSESRCLVSLAVAAAFTWSCSAPADPIEAGEPWPPHASEVFRPVECWFQPPASSGARCGYVSVPDEGERDGAVAIATMVVFGEGAREDPVVFLDGGPGAPAIPRAASAKFDIAPLLAEHDVILLDQRGTGFSDPALRCWSTDGSPSGCHARLSALGHDLDRYNTRQNAADIEAVRQGLGYDSWTLYGSSYGARLALTVARDFGSGVTSMILDGVAPLQVDALAEAPVAYGEGLAALDTACASQPGCGAGPGELERALFESADRARDMPAVLAFTGGIEITIDDVVLVTAVRQLLLNGRVIPQLPARIREFADGDFAFLGEYFGAEPPTPESQPAFALGTYYSVMCQDEASFTTRQRVAGAAARVDARFSLAFDALGLLALCEDWPVSRPPDSENEAVASEVRTLVLSGFFDPITPPRFGALAAETLTGVEHVVLPNQGHGAGFSACGMEVVATFLAGREPAASTDCLRQLAVPRFVPLVPRAL